jgi:hypothetical protein
MNNVVIGARSSIILDSTKSDSKNNMEQSQKEERKNRFSLTDAISSYKLFKVKDPERVANAFNNFFQQLLKA